MIHRMNHTVCKHLGDHPLFLDLVPVAHDNNRNSCATQTSNGRLRRRPSPLPVVRMPVVVCDQHARLGHLDNNDPVELKRAEFLLPVDLHNCRPKGLIREGDDEGALRPARPAGVHYPAKCRCRRAGLRHFVCTDVSLLRHNHIAVRYELQ